MAFKICPWWLGYLFASPVRKLIQDPLKILQPYIEPGMTVADIGCAMGFFSLEMARLVGPSGRVICVDLQEKMLSGLRRRACKAGLMQRLVLQRCTGNSLALDDLAGTVDFALAFAMVHEVPSQAAFFFEVYSALKPAGRLLVAEPKGHVTEEGFHKTIALAAEAGFLEIDRPRIAHSCSVCLQKSRDTDTASAPISG